MSPLTREPAWSKHQRFGCNYFLIEMVFSQHASTAEAAKKCWTACEMLLEVYFGLDTSQKGNRNQELPLMLHHICNAILLQFISPVTLDCITLEELQVDSENSLILAQKLSRIICFDALQLHIEPRVTDILQLERDTQFGVCCSWSCCLRNMCYSCW